MTHTPNDHTAAVRSLPAPSSPGAAALRPAGGDPRPVGAAAAPPPTARGDLRRVVAAAAAGDERAWNALVGRFGAMVRHLARSYRLSEADVDDVAQETWIRLLRHIGTVQDPLAIPAWLATTTRREALRALQRGTREVPSADAADVDEPDGADPADRVAAEERRRALREAIARLPERQRIVLDAVLEDGGSSYAAMADRLGAPIGSLGPTRGRALERLRHDVRLAALVRDPA